MAREARLAAEKRRRRMRTLRNFAIVAVIFVIGIVIINQFTGGSKKASSTPTTTAPTTTPTTLAKLPAFTADPNKNYTATITTNFGTIVTKLDVKTAPKAASRFIQLAQRGFYNGLPWHRVAKDFVIQSGAPKGDGTAISGFEPVVGEVPTDHYPIGALAAAKKQTDPPGTFDSQFFIVTGSQGATLPNDYARFGSVTSGQDVAKKIELLAPASGDGPPTKTATVDKITITES